jgi:hypothetical protein
MVAGLTLHVSDQTEAAVIPELIRLVEAWLHKYALDFRCIQSWPAQASGMRTSAAEDALILHSGFTAHNIF